MILSIFKACLDCKIERVHRELVKKTGYRIDDENWDSIPKVVPPYKEEDLDSLPEKVSLEAFFPPIGNQNKGGANVAYGTCVAWSVGYNLKTALNAIDNKWTPTQLENPEYQTSPRDLWYSLRKKGWTISPCSGSNFQPAFESLISDGASNMRDVPYENKMGNSCTGTPLGDSLNNIAEYAGIEKTDLSVKKIKAYLKDTIPLAFGANLGVRFNSWNSDDVLDSDYGIDREMGHAMVLSGYDDSKHAFRVRNSWGTEWGDNGSIWVDYDFFISDDFCFYVFVAKNGKSHNPESAE